MTGMVSELIIELADIESVVIRCTTCKSQIRVAMGARLGDNYNAPPALSGCPVCQGILDITLMRAVESFRNAITTLDARSASVALQIKTEDSHVRP